MSERTMPDRRSPGAPSRRHRDISAPLLGSFAFASGMIDRCVGKHLALRPAVLLIADAPFASHTVADLAAASGMSRSGFARRFSEAFCTGPIEFLKQERLRYAAHLLGTTQMPIKAVAAQVGYASRSYFSRAIQDAFGASPGTLRATARPADNGAQPSRDERTRIISGAVLDVMWDIDLVTGHVWWSEGMERVFGYGPEQIGPDTAWCHALIHPDDRQRVTDGMAQACDSAATTWQDRFRYRKADGSYATVTDRGVILRDASGRAIRFMGAMQAIPAATDDHAAPAL